MPALTIYTTMFCPYCSRAKALLRSKGLDFQEIGVGMSPSKRAEMIARSGGRNTVPQIFVDDVYIGDCDELYALEAEGRLDAMLTPA